MADIEARVDRISQQRAQLDKKVETATRGAVKKPESPASQRYFRNAWEKMRKKGREAGSGLTRGRMLGGAVAVLGALFTFMEYSDQIEEWRWQMDFMANGMTEEAARTAAEGMSDAAIHAKIMRHFMPDWDQMLYHYNELITEGRPCYVPSHNPKPPPIPHRQGPHAPGQRGGGVGGRGGTSIDYMESFCYEVKPDGTVIPRKC
jgi:hypothetical protein